MASGHETASGHVTASGYETASGHGPASGPKTGRHQDEERKYDMASRLDCRLQTQIATA